MIPTESKTENVSPPRRPPQQLDRQTLQLEMLKTKMDAVFPDPPSSQQRRNAARVLSENPTAAAPSIITAVAGRCALAHQLLFDGAGGQVVGPYFYRLHVFTDR